MIPKTIHYCWFGRNPKPKLARKCIRSWKKHCPDYSIIEWNEDNFDISTCPLYVRQAYEAKKWAFVTDYVRLKVVYEHGGIYLDTDVETVRSFDELLKEHAFFGFEYGEYVNTGLGFGAEKGNPIVGEMMDDYEDMPFVRPDGSFDETTCPIRNSETLLKRGLKQDDSKQLIDGCLILPSEYLCPYDGRSRELNATKKTLSIHWYSASWVPNNLRRSKAEYERIAKRRDLIHNVLHFPNRLVAFLLGEETYGQLKRILKRSVRKPEKMIRILFINSQLVCGGVGQALFDLLSLIDKEKFDVTVLVQYDGGIWEQKYRDAGIRVVSIWDCQRKSRSPLIKLSNYMKRRRIIKCMENDGEGLIDVCFRNQFDVIVSYGVWFFQHIGFSGKAKTVKYIHGDIDSNPQYRENILKNIEVLKQFDRIICVSETARESFEKTTGISQNVTCHFNPLNSDNIRKLASQAIPRQSDVPVVCAVGRLAKEKGFARLIRIHKRLFDEGLQHALLIVGDGPEKENLLAIIEEVHAEKSVIMAGYQDNPYPFMKQSRFLVCSSYTEGLPVIAMEALSLGIPIVSSAPSVGEAFGSETCGLITETDDASLQAGIRKMLAEESFYQQAKAGAQRRSSFFDGKRMVREIEEEFLALANAPGNRM